MRVVCALLALLAYKHATATVNTMRLLLVGCVVVWLRERESARAHARTREPEIARESERERERERARARERARESESESERSRERERERTRERARERGRQREKKPTGCGQEGGITLTRANALVSAAFGQNFRFVLGGLSRCFNCSIPRVRFASYHPTRETLKRARLCTLLSLQLSLSHPHQSKSFSFRFIQY